MDTTASRGGVAPDGPTAGGAGGAGGVPASGSARVRVEVEAMPDGRTIRFYAAAPSRGPTDGAVRSVQATDGAVRSESGAP